MTRVATIGDGMGDTETVLYLPFIDFDCLKNNLTDFDYDNFTESEFRFYNMLVMTLFAVNFYEFFMFAF